MTKLELITKMVKESSRFENLRISGLQIVGPEMLDYVEKVSKFIHQRTEGIAFTNPGLKTNVQVYNKFVADGQGIFNRRIDSKDYMYQGASYKGGGDAISLRIVRKVK